MILKLPLVHNPMPKYCIVLPGTGHETLTVIYKAVIDGKRLHVMSTCHKIQYIYFVLEGSMDELNGYHKLLPLVTHTEGGAHAT